MVSVVVIGIFYLDIINFLDYIAKGSGLLFLNYFRYNDFYNPATDAWSASTPIFFNLWFNRRKVVMQGIRGGEEDGKERFMQSPVERKIIFKGYNPNRLFDVITEK